MIFCRKNRPRAVLSALVASAALACSAAPVVTHADEAKDRAKIAALFEKTLCDGYQARDANKALSIYAPDAVIHSRLYGELALEPFRDIVARDLGRYKELKATAALEDLALAGNEATVAVTLQQRGTLQDGTAGGGSNKYFYRLRRDGDAWKVVLQSYSADLSAPPKPGKHPPVGFGGEQKPARKYH